MSMERSMINAASGGALVNKTLKAAWDLITNMAANSQQFNTRNDPPPPPKRVNEISKSSTEQQISQLTSIAQQLALGHQVKACGLCFMIGHVTDMCPILQDESLEHANAVGSFPCPPRQRCDSYSNSCNERCKDHPNLMYGSPQQSIPNAAPSRPSGYTQS